ncbi:tetratricopeptide repeat protein 28-like [Oculina patagonica]
MDNIVEIIQTIFIGFIVAIFLINTCRVPKAIELCKECLFILDNTPLIKKEKKFKFLYKKIYWTMLLAYGRINDYTNVIKYANKILPIIREFGDRFQEFTVSQTLATSYLRQSKYKEAKEHGEKALPISTEIGGKNGKAFCYEVLGEVHQSVGEYEKAKEYHMKALAIRKEIGHRNGEASCYGNLGRVYEFVGEYEKAKDYHERALAMKKEIGDRDGEAHEYVKLGIVFECVGEYHKAKEYHEKALMIRKEIGDRNGEAFINGNLATVLRLLGEYEKAKEYLEVALAIKKEIGDREGQASCYGNLGNLVVSVGEYLKAKEYYEEAVQIRRKIGDRKGEGTVCGNLGAVLFSLGKYAEADEYLQKALALSKEVGNKRGEADAYQNLGALFRSIGDYEKAREHLEKALTITKEIGDRNGEASANANLGTLLQKLGEYVGAEECYKRALAMSEDIGDVKEQMFLLGKLGSVMILAGRIREAFSYLLPSIQKFEVLRGSLQENDQFKISFSHQHAFLYRVLTELFCSAGKPNEALYVLELFRARALADLMSAQYPVENQISANPQSWAGIFSVTDKELSCTCLYLSYFQQYIYLWILKARTVMYFRKVNGKEVIVHKGLLLNLDEFFTNERFRSFGILLPEEHCEDRSLNDIQRKPFEEDICKASRIGNDGKENQDSLKRNLSLCYKLTIAPVADLIEGPEIIIVPERSLYNIPFAALPDESGKYLSETFRIRVVPSLTTLKLIQDSPADYHSQTGALIVGNPDVGRVRYKGRLKFISPLPCAESEANMIGEKLGVKPFLGKQATKQAVLQVINSVSLIHFAAHGDAERGEIALAPLRTPNRIPREEDYLLTMSDISKVQLRAKLVVLSCCHSGRGQIRAEGVVGIARAFLGSGARSVLVALWALEDSATEQFMSRFYEHLVGGDSASDSLHEAMKWMRCNGYSEVRQWAPFMLIGDNVTFDFGKTKRLDQCCIK